MQMLLSVLLFTLIAVASSENVGQQIGDFFADVGKGLGKGIANVAEGVSDGVNQFVVDNQDLDLVRRENNQKAIDAYKRGEINESQLQTALWIDQYEYQQAVDDRIRNKYTGGNTYPGYNDSINYYPNTGSSFNSPSNTNNGNYGSPGYPGYNGYGTSGYNGYNGQQFNNNGNGWNRARRL